MITFPTKTEWHFLMWAITHKKGLNNIQIHCQILPYKMSISITQDGSFYLIFNRTWIGMFMDAPYPDWVDFCAKNNLDPDDCIPF
jgi:hypothetical protein